MLITKKIFFDIDSFKIKGLKCTKNNYKEKEVMCKKFIYIDVIKNILSEREYIDLLKMVSKEKECEEIKLCEFNDRMMNQYCLIMLTIALSKKEINNQKVKYIEKKYKKYIKIIEDSKFKVLKDIISK